MLHFTDRTKYFLNSHPTDMRKGCEGLANIVRTAMEHNPRNYDEAFIFYSKDYRKVKILHYDINGWVMYSKWFTDGKFLQPKFEECKKCHEISRQILTLLLSTSVQKKSSDMKKSIQDEIDALKAETAAAYAAIAAYNRKKEFYRQQADEAAVELEKVRAELLRVDRENAKLLQEYNALKNKIKH